MGIVAALNSPGQPKNCGYPARQRLWRTERHGGQHRRTKRHIERPSEDFTVAPTARQSRKSGVTMSTAMKIGMLTMRVAAAYQPQR